MEFLAKGHRGVVYLDKYKGKKICVKIEKRDLNRIQNEAKFLKLLNKFNIGPKFISYNDSKMKYFYVSGVPISSKFDKRIALNVLKQSYKMDKLGIDKFEMHHPWKHVLVGKKIVMIDFERCKFSKSPKNVTGFCQFISKQFGVKVPKKLLKDYKSDYSLKNFKKLVSYFKL